MGRRAVWASVDVVPPWPKYNHVGMLDTKILRYVAVPTDGQVGFKHLRELVQRYFIPGQQPAFRTSHCRPVIAPMNLWKVQAAKDAFFAAIPSH